MVLITLLGGCQADKDETSTNPSEIDKEDLPDVHTFEDEFTRKFLQSTEDTEEGFYPFLSKTKQYKMDFPGGGVIDDSMSSCTKNVHEEGTISREDGTGISMHVIYDSSQIEERLTGDLNSLKKQLGHDDDFEKQRGGNQRLYYCHYDRNGFRTYVGYALNVQG